MSIFILLAFWLVSVNTALGLPECSVDRIPAFGSTHDRDRPDRDRFQALVPEYVFQCYGKVTEWRACVEPGGKVDEQFYIQFQVWRPSGQTDGCYSLVNFNIPLDNAMVEEREISESSIIIEAEGFLSPPGDNEDPLHRCVVLPVRENKQIEVQPGDVVGYYVDRFKKSTEDKHDGGIQWLENEGDVLVYYRDRLPREALKTHYAVGGHSPTECGFEMVDDVSLYSLNFHYPALPIISLNITAATSTPSLVTLLYGASKTTNFLPTSVTFLYGTSPITNFLPSSTPLSNDTKSRAAGDVALVLVLPILIPLITGIAMASIVIIKRRKVGSFPLNNPRSSVLAKCSFRRHQQAPTSVGSSIPLDRRSANENYEVTIYTPPLLDYEALDSGNVCHCHNVDYTVIYDDPTSSSYVNEMYSNCSVFESVGTWVPTLEARKKCELSQQSCDEGAKYGNLHFFECDAEFWAPASTTPDLYEQLFTKRYREISRNQICIVEQIGSGEFGTVCKGEWVYTSETMQVAVKQLRQKAGEPEKVKFLQEAAIMGQFFHPNIIRLYGVVTVGDPILIVLEFMPNGDLKSYLDHLVIRQNKQINLQRQFLKYGREIAAGMAYLSKKAFIHRDLAARNILLDEHMSCKVGDFGMARDLMDDTYYKSKGGMIPVKWTAPEALFYKKYSTASDMWSYAMVLYEIWSIGKKPFQDLSNIEVILRLQNQQCLAAPSGCPRQVYSLMVDCWNPQPLHRPTFGEVYQVLQGPEDQLLNRSEEDVSEGRNMLNVIHNTPSFPDLQNKYTELLYELVR